MPTEVDTNYEWFKNRMADKRISQTKLSKLLDMDKSSLSLLLHGKRKMTVDKAADIARILGASVSDVMKNSGVRVDGVDAGPEMRLPVLGWLDAEGIVHKDSRSARVNISMERTPPNSSVVQWRTAHTRMDILDGWFVVVGPQSNPEDGASQGKAGLVQTKDGEIALRAVKRGYEPGSYRLFGIDIEPIAEAELEWFRPVLMMRPA